MRGNSKFILVKRADKKMITLIEVMVFHEGKCVLVKNAEAKQRR